MKLKVHETSPVLNNYNISLGGYLFYFFKFQLCKYVYIWFVPRKLGDVTRYKIKINWAVEQVQLFMFMSYIHIFILIQCSLHTESVELILNWISPLSSISTSHICVTYLLYIFWLMICVTFPLFPYITELNGTRSSSPQVSHVRTARSVSSGKLLNGQVRIDSGPVLTLTLLSKRTTRRLVPDMGDQLLGDVFVGKVGIV
jgi:hypothetical protein